MRVGHDDTLGDLEGQQPSRDVVPRQELVHLVEEALVLHAPGGQVDRDAELEPVGAKGGAGAQRGVQDEGGEGADQSAALGRGDQLVGEHLAELGVGPPHECLDAAHRSGHQVGDRLQVHGEAAVGQGCAQRRHEQEAASVVGVEVGPVDAQPPGRGLRPVHGHVGVLEQGLWLGAVSRGEGDPDRAAHGHGHAVEVDRPGEGSEDAAARGEDFGLHGRPGQQDGELVTAEPGHETGGSDRGDEPV